MRVACLLETVATVCADHRCPCAVKQHCTCLISSSDGVERASSSLASFDRAVSDMLTSNLSFSLCSLFLRASSSRLFSSCKNAHCLQYLSTCADTFARTRLSVSRRKSVDMRHKMANVMTFEHATASHDVTAWSLCGANDRTAARMYNLRIEICIRCLRTASALVGSILPTAAG